MLYLYDPQGLYGDDDDDDAELVEQIRRQAAMRRTTSTSTSTAPRQLSLNTTYVVPNVARIEIDTYAQNLLSSRFPKGVIPTKLVPLETLGDGKCFLHAVSLFLTGMDDYDGKLREMIVNEVKGNKEFYMRTIVEAHMELYKDDEDLKEEGKIQERLEQLYEELLASCNGTDQRMQGWAGMDEAFVLANAIKRPIIVYADKKDIATYGEGILGVGGAFLPLRHDPKDCVSKSPILVSWSTLGLHFCPVVRVTGWSDGERFEFPKVRPALVKHVSLSGDPASNPLTDSGSLNEDESAVIEKYVDYWEPIKEPPKPTSTSSESDYEKRWKTLSEYNKPIPGFAKTLNPEDNQMYDIVIPIDLGTEVDYLAFNLGENFLSKMTTIFNKFQAVKEMRWLSLQRIMSYVIKTLYFIRISYLRSLPAGSLQKGSWEWDSSSAQGKAPRLADYVPCNVVASVPRENSSVEFVINSLTGAPKIPILVPCRFTEEVSDRARNGITEAAFESFAGASNTVIDCLYTYLDHLKKFLAPSSSAARYDVPEVPSPNSGKIIMHDILKISKKSFELFDILRYFALHPLLADFLGTIISRAGIIDIPNESDPICVHIAYVKFVANTLSTLGAVCPDEEEGFDVMNNIYEYPSFMKYFKTACQSTVPELLIAISVLFLNLGVMGGFSPLNIFAAEQYPRLLLSALRMKHIPLLRNVLLGLATLLYNDCAAVSVLSKCPPMESLLEEAKKLDPEFSQYADCCWSIICFTAE